MMRATIFLYFGFVTGVLAGGPCVAVTGDWITASELGQIDPAFLALPGTTPILRSPFPGTPRHIHPGEIARLASKWNLDAHSARSGCFEYPVAPLTIEPIRQAILLAVIADKNLPLANSPPRVEVIEWPRESLPAGELRFDLSRLRPSADQQSGCGRWVYGELRLFSARRVPVWVKACVRAEHEIITAISDLTKDSVLQARDIRLESRETDLLELLKDRDRLVQTMDAALGQRLTKNLPAGALLTAKSIQPSMQIQRGELLDLEIVSGLARLRLPAKAESAGAIGDQIAVRIDKGSKRLFAEVVGPRAAQIQAGRMAPDKEK